MTRLCMIGNSHVAAMRFGWEQVAADRPEIQPDIFGAHARNLVTAEVNSDGEIVCDGAPFWFFSAGAEPSRARRIRPENYDCTVIVGSDFGPLCVFKTYRRYHFSGLKGRRRQALTREYFKRAVTQLAHESAAHILASTIRKTSDKPILLVPTPMPAENGYSDLEKTNMESWQYAVAVDDTETLLEIYGELCGDIRSEGFVIVDQPAFTKASPVSTLQKYSDDSVRLRADENVLHPENDYFHMNGTYGAIMWNEIISTLEALPAG